MAERRMFAKSIVLSDAFLDLPMSARCLYFTLGMLADDDGFIGNPKAIMRQCGASNDDILVLLQKRFLLTFESGVIVIKHWRMNNYLRNDRHISTTYVEELATLRLDEKGAYTERDRLGIPSDNQMTTNGIPRIGEDRLGEDRLDKDREGVVSSDEDESPKQDVVPYQKVIDEFNRICCSLRKVTVLSDKRKQAIKARLNKYSFSTLIEAFEKVEASSFLKGANNRDWSANFDWIMNDTNMAKILDGNYDDRGGGSSAGRRKDDGGVSTSYATPDINELYRQKHQNDK